MLRLFLPFLLILTAAVRLPAEDVADHEAWLRSFYRTRELGPFDAYWTVVMEQGVLEQPGQVEPTIGFVSRILHRNPSLVRTHMVELAAYPLAQREAMARIFAYSDTEEGRARLRAAGRTRLAGQPIGPIARHRIEDATDLDFCWGWFFASGDLSALDPILAALDLASSAGARDRFAAGARTPKDRLAAVRDAIHTAAVRSLTANTRADSFIARHLETVVQDPRTPPVRAEALAGILKAARL